MCVCVCVYIYIYTNTQMIYIYIYIYIYKFFLKKKFCVSYNTIQHDIQKWKKKKIHDTTYVLIVMMNHIN